MTKLNTEQQAHISDAIASVEKQTDAELVAVLAKQSDSYHYIPMLWAALFALLTPFILMLLPFWLDTAEIFFTQSSVFIVVAVIFRLPAVYIRLIPKSVRYWRAANMARRQFLENNLHHTSGETGVLIFVSVAERYVEIIADRGINEKVEQTQWQVIVDQFIEAIKKNEVLKGYADAVNACGEILIQHVPASKEKNELPNRLVVLG